jgi:hypothetical protein
MGYIISCIATLGCPTVKYSFLNSCTIKSSSREKQ